jgi:hypothetical protein
MITVTMTNLLLTISTKFKKIVMIRIAFDHIKEMELNGKLILLDIIVKLVDDYWDQAIVSLFIKLVESADNSMIPIITRIIHLLVTNSREIVIIHFQKLLNLMVEITMDSTVSEQSKWLAIDAIKDLSFGMSIHCEYSSKILLNLNAHLEKMLLIKCEPLQEYYGKLELIEIPSKVFLIFDVFQIVLNGLLSCDVLPDLISHAVWWNLEIGNILIINSLDLNGFQNCNY